MATPKYVIANWKMNTRRADIQAWCAGASELSATKDLVKAVVAPPAIYLNDVRRHLPSSVSIAAQDASAYEHDGAHTGEVSAQMLADVGCEYVIIGHSERRADGDEKRLQAKLAAIIAADLIPVFCVGESLETRDAGDAWAFVESQLQLLDEYPQDKALIIAYEPIWAIGTGMTASLADVEQMHTQIFEKMKRPVLYGGSVKPSNAKELMNGKNVSGALVGGASLKVVDFLAIVEAAS